MFHTYTHNPRLDVVPGTSFGGPIGTPFIRGQTWWQHMPLFTDYLARCHYLLQQGQPVIDVLWYLGDAVDHKPRQNAPFPAGFKYDYANADALIHHLFVQDGMLRNAAGNSWRVLWLRPENCALLTVPTLRRLRELLRDGATVIGPAPRQNASLTGGPAADVEFAALIAELWGDPLAPNGDRRIGAGRLLWDKSLDTSIAALGLTPDVTGTSSATWTHRREGDTDIYFIAADRLSPLDANLTFRTTGTPTFWDPVTGERQPATIFSREPDQTRVALNLPAAGSVFVVFSPESSAPVATRIIHNMTTVVDATDGDHVDRANPFPYLGLTPGGLVQPWITPPPLAPIALPNGKHLLVWQPGHYQVTRSDQSIVTGTTQSPRSISLESGWTLSFPAGWDSPAHVELPRLKPWSDLSDPVTAAFAGTATYRRTIDLPAFNSDTRLTLDLGRVSVIATVRLNGQPVAKLWAPPFRTDITPFALVGKNELEIEVTNTWHNRLRYDASLPEADRKTWTIFAPVPDASAEISGIVGPVQIHVGSIISLHP